MSEQIYPDIHFPNITELDLRLASYYFPILTEIAKRKPRQTITYGDLLKEARKRHPEYFHNEEGRQRESDYSTGRRLGTIWRFTEKYGYPIISTLVVNATTGECGRGVTENLDPIEERRKVYSFDWDTDAPEFLAHLKYEEEINRKRKVKKPKTLSSQEAAESLGNYWKETKDRWPAHLANHRDELIEEIEKGYDPATVFSGWVLKNAKPTKSPNYLYLATYINALTGNPVIDASEIKIGCTGNLKARAHALSGGVKAPIAVIITHAWKVETGNAFAVEQRLHGHFLDHKAIGEWFNCLDGALLELIQEQIAADSLIAEIVSAVEIP